MVATLGLTRERTPAVSTLHLVVRDLEAAALERALTTWARAHLGDAEAIAIDGKGLRGIHGEEEAGGRLAAAYRVGAGLVLAPSGGSAPVRETTSGRES